MEYPVVLELDPETGYWVAEVPGIAGAYSQGKDKEEALVHVREALRLVLAEQGPPKGYRVEFSSIEA
jgi:predicted RNase H-like HicB family nuclease